MEYTPGQEVEQLGLHVVHQAGGGGSLPPDLLSGVQSSKILVLLQPGWPSLMAATPTPSPRILSWPFSGEQVIKAAGLSLGTSSGHSGKNLPNNQFTNLKCSASTQVKMEKGSCL